MGKILCKEPRKTKNLKTNNNKFFALNESIDIMGNALKDYFSGKHAENITVISSIAEDDELSLPYLFREEKDLPEIEKKAISLCYGKVLDVGAGSGLHSSILRDKNLEVLAIDTSEGAVEVMRKRGLYAKNIDLLSFKNEQFDTILLLMNGVGIAQKLKQLTSFLSHLKGLLTPNGQILMDSSDIKYLFTELDGSYWLDLNSDYYGEVTYQMKYNNETGKPFSWLFVDKETLKKHALKVGLNCEIIMEDHHYGFLARLTSKEKVV